MSIVFINLVKEDSIGVPVLPFRNFTRKDTSINISKSPYNTPLYSLVLRTTDLRRVKDCFEDDTVYHIHCPGLSKEEIEESLPEIQLLDPKFLGYGSIRSPSDVIEKNPKEKYTLLVYDRLPHKNMKINIASNIEEVGDV